LVSAKLFLASGKYSSWQRLLTLFFPYKLVYLAT
jgi:hypothetical protein